MAILEKEVILTWKGINKNYYRSKGYNFTKIEDSLIVNVDDLKEGSNVKVTKICDDCGINIPHQRYSSIINYRKNGDGKDRCFKCGNIKRGQNQKSNVKYENSLYLWAKQNDSILILNEFSVKNNKRPHEISYGNRDLFLWNCDKCKSEFYMSPHSRTRNRREGCPYCAGQKVNHTNCLWTTHSHISSLLEDKKLGYELTSGTAKKVNFICDRCNQISNKQINVVTRLGFSCSRCSDNISYPEKFMMSVLNQLNIKYETQKTFIWSNKKRYDFYLPSLNTIIETHGEQHYRYTGRGRSLEKEQENDKSKENLASENGIENYIIIDCRNSSLEWIKKEVANSKLNELYNLNKINWIEVHELTCNSLVKLVCDLWNEGIRNTLEIGTILRLGRSTIIRYLKQGTKIGWCNYNPEEVKKSIGRKRAIINAKNLRKQIIQLTLEGEFIKCWESVSQIFEKLRVSNISRVCDGTYKQAGGYKWMYIEDYEKYIEQTQIYNNNLHILVD